MKLGNLNIGDDQKPLIIPEIGINHEGDFDKAVKMIKDIAKSGAKCVKFQCHVIEDEMIENDVIPPNANETIWNMMKRCSFSESEEIELKKISEDLGLVYLSTPFSREAANRLERMNIDGFKIGSGECNNFPLIKHIASFGKPVILSTGMNEIQSIQKAVKILEEFNLEYAILHVTSMYPTPYENVRLRVLNELKEKFPKAIIGLSDHSIGNYTSFAAIGLGAKIIEKHFTSDKKWPGPDIPVSIDPSELKDLIYGCNAIFSALEGTKNILEGEKATANFAYASVVTTKDLEKNEVISEDNIWVKRPGTGEILAEYYEQLIGKKVSKKVTKNTQLKWDMIE